MNSDVFRLKRLWVSLSDRALYQFEELEELMLTQNNFKNYYNELTRRQQLQQPIVPYFGKFD